MVVEAIFDTIDAIYYATEPFWQVVFLALVALLLWTLVDTTRPPRW